jgi:S1-C subfamily serine protease
MRDTGRLGAAVLFVALATLLTAQPVRGVSGGNLPPWFVQVNHRIDPERYLEVKRADMPDFDVHARTTVRLTNLTAGLLVDTDGHVVSRLVNYDPRVTDLELTVTSNDGRKLPATLVGLDAPSGFVVLHVPGLRGTQPAPAARAQAIAASDAVRLLRRDYATPIPIRTQPPGKAPVARTNILPTLPPVPGTVDSVSVPAHLARIGVASTLRSGALVPAGDLSLVHGASGQLLGIARYEQPGRGYLVPIAFLKDVVARRVLDAHGSVECGWLGADGTSVNEPPTAVAGAAATTGVRITALVGDGPGARGGLLVDDVITAFDGVAVATIAELGALVRATPATTAVSLAVVRAGKSVTVDVVLGRRPAPSPVRLAATAPDFGLKILDLNPQLAEFLGVSNGVFVEYVRAGTPAGLAGLRAGDVITMIEDRPITSRVVFNSAVVEAQSPTVTIAVHREKKIVLLKLSLTAPR